MGALVPLVLFGAIAGPFFLVTAFRKRCPSCGRRELAFDGRGLSAPESPPPRHHKRYLCARCRTRFASPSPGIFVPQIDWDRGIRTAAPTARVIKD